MMLVSFDLFLSFHIIHSVRKKSDLQDKLFTPQKGCFDKIDIFFMFEFLRGVKIGINQSSNKVNFPVFCVLSSFS